MKLDRLFAQTPYQVLKEYLDKVENLSSKKIISEGYDSFPDVLEWTRKKVEDRPEHQTVVNDAIEVGEFDNPRWVKQLLNGLKQVGVHGLTISKEERPVTVGEMKQIIDVIIELVERRNRA